MFSYLTTSGCPLMLVLFLLYLENIFLSLKNIKALLDSCLWIPESQFSRPMFGVQRCLQRGHFLQGKPTECCWNSVPWSFGLSLSFHFYWLLCPDRLLELFDTILETEEALTLFYREVKIDAESYGWLGLEIEVWCFTSMALLAATA